MRYSLKSLFILAILTAFGAWWLALYLDDPIVRIKQLGGQHYQAAGDDGLNYIFLTSPPFDPSNIDELVFALDRTSDPWEIFIHEIPDKHLGEFENAKNILRIYLGESGIGNEGLIALGKIPSLKEVKIKRCFNLDSDGIAALRSKRPDIVISGWRLGAVAGEIAR